MKQPAKFDDFKRVWTKWFGLRDFSLEEILYKKETILGAIAGVESHFDRKLLRGEPTLGVLKNNEGVTVLPASMDEARTYASKGYTPTAISFPFQTEDGVLKGAVHYYHASAGYGGYTALIAVNISPIGFTTKKQIDEYSLLVSELSGLR